MMTGKVTIEVDLKDFGADLDYPFEDLLRDEIGNYIRSHIRKTLLQNHKEMLNKWTADYLKGKHPPDSEGVVMLNIPIEFLR